MDHSGACGFFAWRYGPAVTSGRSLLARERERSNPNLLPYRLLRQEIVTELWGGPSLLIQAGVKTLFEQLDGAIEAGSDVGGGDPQVAGGFGLLSPANLADVAQQVQAVPSSISSMRKSHRMSKSISWSAARQTAVRSKRRDLVAAVLSKESDGVRRWQAMGIA